MSISSFNEYNLDIAFNLLGPANFAEDAPQNLLEHLWIKVSEIVLTILRAYNYYLGDQKWYDNATARQILIDYIDSERGLDLSNQTHKKVALLFDELQFRQFDSEQKSWAFDLKEMARCQGINFEINDLSDSLEFPQLPPKNHYQIVKGQLRKFSTGDLSSLKFFEAMKHCFTVQSSQVDPIVNRNNREIKSLKIFMDSNPETTLKKIDDIKKSLINREESLRSSFPTSYKDDGTPLDPAQSSISIQDFDFNTQYKSIKDPLVLFKTATLKVLDKLGLKDRFINGFKNPLKFDDQNKLVKTSYFSSLLNFFGKGEISDEDIDIVCLFVVIELLENATVDLADCHHRVHLSPIIYTRYQKPSLSYWINSMHSISPRFPFLVHHEDLFSSSDFGCDPEAALAWLNQLKNDYCLDQFKDLIRTKRQSSFSSSEKKAFDLIQDMARQFKRLHLESVRLSILEQEQIQESHSFENAVKNSKSSYEYFKNAFLYVAQKYAKLGLFAQDDFCSDQISQIESFLAKAVVLETLLLAKDQDDFSLKINDFVTLKFADFYAFEPDDEGLSIEGKKKTLQNLLCSNDEDIESSLDPLYIANIFRMLRGEANKYGELTFIRQYLLYESEAFFYKQKLEALQDESTELDSSSSLISLEELDFTKKNIQFIFRKLPKSSKDLLREIRYGVFNMASNLVRNFFQPNSMAFELYDSVEFNLDVLPSLSKDYSIDSSKLDLQIKKDVELQFIPSHLKDQITIKRRPEKILPIKGAYQVSEQEVRFNNKMDLVLRQNDRISNPSNCGNCGYGALAQELFGRYVNTWNINEVSDELRYTVANYISSNKELFLDSMLKLGETKTPSITPKLYQRLEAHCRELRSLSTGNWISELEFEVIAMLFGVRIEIINMALPLKIGKQGLLQGLILPNLCYGSQYKGAAIRLLFINNNHFQVLKLKD